MISIEHVLFVGALLLFISVMASKASDRFGVPALLLFLGIGMLAGSEGIGKIYFNDPWLAKSLGVLALIFILYSGGLDTSWKDIRHVLAPGVALATVGVLLTAVFVGIFAVYMLKFSPLEGALLGAIVSSTDAAAIFSVLKSKRVSLRGKLRPLLELESGSNDPMAVFLTLGLIQLLSNPTLPVLHLIPTFILEFAVGLVMGYLCGKGIVIITNRIKLAYEGLYPVLMIAMVILVYAVTAFFKGNGFLSVYIASVIVGNSNFIHKKTLMKFHEGLAWLMQIAMFLALGLLVFPSKIVPVVGIGLLIALFLMFIARPVSVFLCLAFSKLTVREKTMVSWVGLRGAVPIILATFPLSAGLPKADLIFNIVFFISLTSVLFQGTSVPFVSRLLKVDAPVKDKPLYPLEFEYTGKINATLEDIIVPYHSEAVGKSIVKLGVPTGALIVLVSRDDQFFIPNGATIIKEGDVLLVLANKQDLQRLYGVVNRVKSGVAA
ncbi:MAG TPA: potassium/proton antiporter [Candidatus Omnitrophota bacterium]|nr:potassium/proton antiporter [Candidatus Omnitrophota bacterium]HPT07131.1 potassium/proton antiporter [Candidatus Omnitrophota bacterium]